MIADGELPLGIMTPDENADTERWNHEINPPADRVISLPMRVVFISRNAK
ncbi:MAG: hypothetical protein J6H20_08730 [Pyramidobacter sp.]|nr:hypothetical protein [Pyramidobacter sp.]